MAETITVIAANFSHVFPSTVLQAIQEQAGDKYNIHTCATQCVQEYEHEQLKKILERKKPCGLISICLNPAKGLFDIYKQAGVPVVIIDEEVEGYTTITGDNIMGGYLAGEYFAKAGRKKPAIVAGKMKVEGGYNSEQRYKGFVKGLEDNGITFNTDNLAQVIHYSYKDGDTAIGYFVKEEKVFDSVFCAAGDMCAMGLIKGARENNIKIPEDILLIGYDDIDQARTSRPPLTTIKQPIKEMAVKAFELVVKEPERLLNRPEKILLKPDLIKRESA